MIIIIMVVINSLIDHFIGTNHLGEAEGGLREGIDGGHVRREHLQQHGEHGAPRGGLSMDQDAIQ